MRAATQEPENCASQHFAQTDLAPRTCEGEGSQKLRHGDAQSARLWDQSKKRTEKALESMSEFVHRPVKWVWAGTPAGNHEG